MVLRELIQRNFWLKLLSLVLAVVAWVMIRGSEDLSVAQTPILNPVINETAAVPVNVLDQPRDGRIFKITPETVSITVTAESALLRKFTRKDYKAYVDLTETRNPNPEEEVKMHVPAGVTVLKVVPRVVTIEQIPAR
jgi:YbbR domain-containing protein